MENNEERNLRLRLFVKEDAPVIAKWCQDRDVFYRWSAGLFGEYPLNADVFSSFMEEQRNNKSYFSFVAFDSDGPQGFFIMRCPGEDNTAVRFGFIIVNPEIRGKGYGKKMISLGKKFATEIYGAKTIGLGVFDNNPKAMWCYKACGFKETGETEQYTLDGETWTCVEMLCNPLGE